MKLNDILFLLPNWKWIALLIAFLAAYVLRGIIYSLVSNLRGRLSPNQRKESLTSGKVSKSFLVNFLQEKIESPLSWLASLVFLAGVFNLLELHSRVELILNYCLKFLGAFHLIRLSYLAANALGGLFQVWISERDEHLNVQLAPFFSRTLKILVIVIGTLLALQNFGFNVWSLIAGLGIGGIALALAGQETAANLFGSVTILLDRPFQLGDFIKVGDTEGIVEDIGFRSTRIRTFYNSLISIPNSTMAKEKIDNMGARPYRRIRHLLGLEYSTPPELIEAFCEKLRAVVHLIPEARKEEVVVNFHGMGDFSLNVLMNFHLQVDTYQRELEIQQHLLLEILKIAQAMGVSFAFPTSTVHLHQSGKSS